MHIERLTERYIEQTAELEVRCFSMPWSRATLESEIRNPTCLYLAAVENLELLGYVGMQTVLDEGYINNVAVSPEHRRKGIASALIDELIRRAQALGLAFLTLEVRAGNAPAIALYEKHGFSPVGLRKNYYEKPREDAILMTRFFEAQNTPASSCERTEKL